jgi:hypothetical protein
MATHPVNLLAVPAVTIFPEIPTPPLTTNAPVVVDVLAVVLATTKLPVLGLYTKLLDVNDAVLPVVMPDNMG